jgi:hypothetical protein
MLMLTPFTKHGTPAEKSTLKANTRAMNNLINIYSTTTATPYLKNCTD